MQNVEWMTNEFEEALGDGGRAEWGGGVREMDRKRELLDKASPLLIARF